MGEPISLQMPFESVVIISRTINWNSIEMSVLGRVNTVEAGAVIENEFSVKDGYGNLVAPLHLFTGLQLESGINVNSMLTLNIFIMLESFFDHSLTIFSKYSLVVIFIITISPLSIFYK